MKITWDKLKAFLVVIFAAFIAMGGWAGKTIYSQITEDIKDNKQHIRTIAEIQTETIIKLAELVKDDEFQKERLRDLERRTRGTRPSGTSKN